MTTPLKLGDVCLADSCDGAPMTTAGRKLREFFYGDDHGACLSIRAIETEAAATLDAEREKARRLHAMLDQLYRATYESDELVLLDDFGNPKETRQNPEWRPFPSRAALDALLAETETP